MGKHFLPRSATPCLVDFCSCFMLSQWKSLLHRLVKFQLFAYTVHYLTAFSVHSRVEANHEAMFGRMGDESKKLAS